MARIRLGEVTHFDEGAGWGAVRADDGRTLPFHCTSVADGSRSVAIGRRVAFMVAPGDHGRWEARQVVVTDRT